MTTILALDSSSENCSAAVYDQQTMSLMSEYAPRKHTQLILPLVKKALANRALALNDVSAIAFGCGPGSFTGIRIAAGVAQGLAYGLDVPIFAISNLKALALQSYLEHGISRVLVCIDARMSEIYWGLFEVSKENVSRTAGEGDEVSFIRFHIKTLIDEQVGAPDAISVTDLDLENHALAGIGSGIDLLSEALGQCLSLSDANAQPNADTIAYLAETEIALGASGNMNDALPNYVRDTVTWNKLPGRE